MSMFSESLRAFLRPVVEFLDDPSVSEIMINGPEDVWIERHGKLIRTAARFTEDGLLAAARNMAQFVGRPLSDEHPRLDARLPDGSRIHVLLPPMARCGTVISIRKFHPGGLVIDDLIKYRSITPEAARFLECCVLIKRNMMVAGGTGSGKTTLLNVISHFIPDDERILTIEDSAELQLNQQHLVPLESRPPDRHGKHAVMIRDLLHSSLRLRPDRIVIGEVRGGECFDLLQAMNTGHGGTLSTVHANSALETLSRLESLALLSDIGLPLRALRSQVASAIHVVVCTNRLRDGSRRITSISEVLPLDDKGDYRVQDIFVFTQTTSARTGRVQGYLSPTGVMPTFQAALIADGFEDMAPSFFFPDTYGYPPPRHFIGEPARGMTSIRQIAAQEAAAAQEPVGGGAFADHEASEADADYAPEAESPYPSTFDRDGGYGATNEQTFPVDGYDQQGYQQGYEDASYQQGQHQAEHQARAYEYEQGAFEDDANTSDVRYAEQQLRRPRAQVDQAGASTRRRASRRARGERTELFDDDTRRSEDTNPSVDVDDYDGGHGGY
ncbi:MAG: type II secretion protein [Proteobacteria bacterium]|nr:MAG: type II secretion protein [Pseudomonadota bacterium]